MVLNCILVLLYTTLALLGRDHTAAYGGEAPTHLSHKFILFCFILFFIYETLVPCMRFNLLRVGWYCAVYSALHDNDTVVLYVQYEEIEYIV